MAVGDPIKVLKLDDNYELKPYMVIHILKANKTKSTETYEAGGEQNAAYVTFTIRWNKMLSPIEFNMPDYRVVWHGQEFDVIGYDDFMYQHRKVNLSCRSLGAYIETDEEADNG